MAIDATLKDYIIGLQHVGHIVEDLQAAIAGFKTLYGVDDKDIRVVPDATDTRFAFVTVGDTEFELIEPVSEYFKEVLLQAPSGGAGINHVAWRVSDLGACMRILAAEGITPGYVTPDGPIEFAGKRFVYLEPAATGGLYVELIEISKD